MGEDGWGEHGLKALGSVHGGSGGGAGLAPVEHSQLDAAQAIVLIDLWSEGQVETTDGQ
jgi:hypothetical protein